jgi:hypothetical protein
MSAQRGIDHVILWDVFRLRRTPQATPPLVALFGRQKLGHLPMAIAQGPDRTVEIVLRLAWPAANAGGGRITRKNMRSNPNETAGQMTGAAKMTGNSAN